MLKIYINGKFLSQNITGVQRVALKYLENLGTCADDSFEFIVIENKHKGIFSILFEQFVLPYKTRGGMLINFCNIAPIFKKKQLTFIHDAAFIALNNHSLLFRLYYRFMMYFVTRNCLKVITVSEFSKNELLKYYKNLKEKDIEVIKNGFDFQSNYCIDSDIISIKEKYKNIYLTVSSMDPRKNLNFILKAWSKRNSSKDLLIIVGGKSEHFKQEEINLNLKNILFTGYVSDNQLCSYYKISDYFISASEYEGFGLPVAESLNFNCIPILSDIPVYKELFYKCSLFFCLDDLSVLQSLLDEDKPPLQNDIKRYLNENRWEESTKRLIKVIAHVGF